ncbi:MAG: efflux RND transporter periplasmic adaptor subunit [Armatimonadetes bacterium]|nr:efflux RND transporter periplasmic adaptor subunit [Armatimonadota bacterium]
MRKWVVVIVILAVVLAGGVLASRRRPAATSPQAAAQPTEEPAVVEVVAVRRGTIERTLELSGSIISAQEVHVTPRMAGKIAALLVGEGSHIARGQAVARLEATELIAQVAQAEQAVKQARAGQEVARARLAALQSGARLQERALAESAVRQAEANLKNAEATAIRLQQLFEAGAVSRQELDAAVLQRDVASAQLESARQQLSLVQTGAREEDLRTARAQVVQADAAHAAAVASLNLARAQLSDATVRAPFAGRIAEIPVTVGEFVAPGMNIATLYDDQRLEVEVAVGERDLHLVRPGAAVTLSPEALPGRTLRGAVRLVLPAADPSSRTAKARITLIDLPTGLLPGTFVRAAIVVERRSETLLIPRQALRAGGEVAIVEGGVARLRTVTAGLEQGALIEVTAGLRGGEQVIVLGPEALRDGQPVKVVVR